MPTPPEFLSFILAPSHRGPPSVCSGSACQSSKSHREYEGGPAVTSYRPKMKSKAAARCVKSVEKWGGDLPTRKGQLGTESEEPTGRAEPGKPTWKSRTGPGRGTIVTRARHGRAPSRCHGS